MSAFDLLLDLYRAWPYTCGTCEAPATRTGVGIGVGPDGAPADCRVDCCDDEDCAVELARAAYALGAVCPLTDLPGAAAVRAAKTFLEAS